MIICLWVTGRGPVRNKVAPKQNDVLRQQQNGRRQQQGRFNTKRLSGHDWSASKMRKSGLRRDKAHKPSTAETLANAVKDRSIARLNIHQQIKAQAPSLPLAGEQKIDSRRSTGRHRHKAGGHFEAFSSARGSSADTPFTPTKAADSMPRPLMRAHVERANGHISHTRKRMRTPRESNSASSTTTGRAIEAPQASAFAAA